MFETAILSNGPRTKRVWATIAGFTGQVMVIGCALIAPLLFPQVIPKVAYVMSIAPPGPPPPPPPPGGDNTPRHPRVIPVTQSALKYPTRIPTTTPVIIDDVEAPSVAGGSRNGVPGGVDGGVDGGILTTLLNGSGHYAPVPKPPEPVKPVTAAAAPPATTTPPRRISIVKMATPIHRVDPIYPQIAKTAGISGTVELIGVLGTDGRIHELRVVRGHPLLIEAAMAAVKQWVYAPTLLNGEPVEVQAPIQVNFILHR
jgi:protein TonB